LNEPRQVFRAFPSKATAAAIWESDGGKPNCSAACRFLAVMIGGAIGPRETGDTRACFFRFVFHPFFFEKETATPTPTSSKDGPASAGSDQ